MTQRYVAKWGDDSSGDGLTWATAYLTIDKALTDVADGSGDWINVAPGDYEENPDLRSLADTTLNLLYNAKVWSSGVPNLPTIRMGDRCVIRGGGTVEHQSEEYAVAIVGKDDCQFLDVLIDGSDAHGLDAGDFVNLTIQRCRIVAGEHPLYCANGTGLRLIDTHILGVASEVPLRVFGLELLYGKHFIKGGSIVARMYGDVDFEAVAMRLVACDLRVVDVIIEAHNAKITTAATNPTIAVNVVGGGNVVLDGCTIQAHADHVDTDVYDLRTNEYPSLIGVLNLTHRTTYDSNKVSGPIVTGVTPVREWYAARADIEKLFGIRNVEIWADLDADEDTWKIQQRIEDFCEDASAEVESILRRAGFTIPLADSSGSLPKQFTHWVATLAGVNLYEARGVEDADDGNNRLLVQRERVMSELGKIASGHRRTTLVRTGGVTPSAKTFTLAIKS